MEEYTDRPGLLQRWVRRWSGLGGDRRPPEAHRAFEDLFAGHADQGLFLSVGGGPLRVHPRLINLNLGPYLNVDVVGTAYRLPLADASIDGVYCEAVLEHLEFPARAVKEMHRVLQPGGRVFAATPFLQGYHGYPSHFQNFTLEGHVRLFERAGFEVERSGTCAGPSFALADLASLYLRHYLPGRWLSRSVSLLVRIGSVPFRALDHWLSRRSDGHLLASSTWLLAQKTGTDLGTSRNGV